LWSIIQWLGADLDSIIRCRHWSSVVESKDNVPESKFVFEILCIKKQQKFKFVFEKISKSDPFRPMHDSLSMKIATAQQQKGAGIGTPTKESTQVIQKSHKLQANPD
jgi:hypothetical protein